MLWDYNYWIFRLNRKSLSNSSRSFANPLALMTRSRRLCQFEKLGGGWPSWHKGNVSYYRHSLREIFFAWGIDLVVVLKQQHYGLVGLGESVVAKKQQ